MKKSESLAWNGTMNSRRHITREADVLSRARRQLARDFPCSHYFKDLHLDWARGARWFMDHLVDGDLASNQHGWQWVAGTGTDAAPWFRVFNPTTQGRKFDPDGDYVRRWVPELRRLENGHVHEPWTAPAGLDDGYPAPIVDHAEERREALDRLEKIRT